ncbi:hypothetical protein P8610_19855 [Fictibacillus sp. UD]|uniref:hypothetical protein n=1 Tax=Fictibacillus sp. UD TaxID=3038777 RepID=UPI003745DFE4
MKRKVVFIFDILLFLAAFLGLVYCVFYRNEWLSIQFWTFLIVAISSAIRVTTDIKDGFY